MSSEQKAVEDIEALAIGRAIGPGLDVAGTQELWLVNSGNQAPPAPIIDKALAKKSAFFLARFIVGLSPGATPSSSRLLDRAACTSRTRHSTLRVQYATVLLRPVGPSA